MILFTVKLISSIRKAIAGRKHPSQLAWGVALGVLLGIIPHGNLLAVAMVLVVLMLQVNHAMVALVGVGLTFFASKLDPQFDALGRWIFDQPDVAQALASAWQLPLVPWTDLNNTVVMGSFVSGLAAVPPCFMLTYPVFKRWALALEEADEDEVNRADEKVNRFKSELQDDVKADRFSDQRMHDAHGQAGPHVRTTAPSKPASELSNPPSETEQRSPMIASSGRVYDVRRVDDAQTVAMPAAARSPEPQKQQPTKVAIASTGNIKSQLEVQADNASADDQQKIDEALNYLLRQLRDSKDKDAA
ncbi:TIGR03546 family protein [Neorhodopirellula lusitana]|uniref:TIGR03546 family protein n=1 Tax=Neorhodopirellula lusitana TaxID=445327 RepID=A0ABY1Q3I0_9BACT|nr:DUF2062 domain-containing protein [Neorhodopirellula lusitana]SMP57090.1 TIGR03546 family protein [Neorhodopirellula lusitana]